MLDIGSILASKIKLFQENTPQEAIRKQKVEYSKEWAHGVACFRHLINQDRKREGGKFPPMTFIAVRQKLEHIENIEDLRWFFYQCKKYAAKRLPDGTYPNTFSKCFFGALKMKS